MPPMKPCHIYMVPSHALEVAEIVAVKEALQQKVIESRFPLTRCYDVLFQHLTSLAVGGGFEYGPTYRELRSTLGFSDLTEEEFQDVLDHLMHGGKSLEAYPDYQKLVREGSFYRIIDKKVASRHRMTIGTIASDTSVQLKKLNGQRIGQVEEQFMAKLQKGEAFTFAGKVYELVQMADLSAIVRLSRKREGTAPVWLGSQLPLSPSLSYQVRRTLDAYANHPMHNTQEEFLLEEICTIQAKYSLVPQSQQLLMESMKTREGWHAFFIHLKAGSSMKL